MSSGCSGLRSSRLPAVPTASARSCAVSAHRTTIASAGEQDYERLPDGVEGVRRRDEPNKPRRVGGQIPADALVKSRLPLVHVSGKRVVVSQDDDIESAAADAGAQIQAGGVPRREEQLDVRQI